MSKILIVDDERQLVDMLEMRLTAVKYEVLKANSGEECLQVVAEQIPDLILLDIMMPGIDGIETLKRLQQEDKTKSIPVLMLTAAGNPEIIEKALNQGATDYILKPFEPAVLFKKIKDALS